MGDSKYCYPETDILINKLDIREHRKLFEAEKELTFIRLQELQSEPIRGNFDFAHLLTIHKYIFQDIYEWAGKIRTVEIGKGNLFCLTEYIQEFGNALFKKFFTQCYSAKDNRDRFVVMLAENYGDLNALHPFREGNGRAQREFARCLCLACGYGFDLSCTTHEEMLNASIISFDKGDNSYFEKIFSRAIYSYKDRPADENPNRLRILSADDLVIGTYSEYGYNDSSDYAYYKNKYESMIREMKNMSD